MILLTKHTSAPVMHKEWPYQNISRTQSSFDFPHNWMHLYSGANRAVSYVIKPDVASYCLMRSKNKVIKIFLTCLRCLAHCLLSLPSHELPGFSKAKVEGAMKFKLTAHPFLVSSLGWIDSAQFAWRHSPPCFLIWTNDRITEEPLCILRFSLYLCYRTMLQLQCSMYCNPAVSSHSF